MPHVPCRVFAENRIIEVSMSLLQEDVVNDMKLRPWQTRMHSAPWVWGLALAVMTIGGMVLADFCIVDDWLVVRWFGDGDGLPFSRIWPALLETEVGGVGSAGRFRPIFFLHLELEAWLFGDRAGLYQALRVLYFGLFLGAVGRVAVRCIGLLPAFALVAGIAGLGFWSDLWTRSLGPTEQFGTPRHLARPCRLRHHRAPVCRGPAYSGLGASGGITRHRYRRRIEGEFHFPAGGARARSTRDGRCAAPESRLCHPGGATAHRSGARHLCTLFDRRKQPGFLRRR
jgi:hypothetical protein